MVKICAVGDCKGGSAADKSERQLRGVRQLALFKVPKSQEDLKRWADLLGTPLNGNSVVCEQHFSKDDVRTEDSFILEGCRAVLPRLRCSLQRGALPLSRIIDDQTSSAEDSAVVTDDPVSCPDDAAPTVVNEVVGMTIQRFTTALIETPLPPTWCWFQSNEKIVFTQIDQFTSKIKLFVDIQPDLSIIIRSPDNREKVDLGRKAETVACVFDIIKSCKACNGTGVKPESRSENCRFLISKEDYQRPVAVPRCLYCRKLRIKILKKRLRSATNIKVRYARCQREVYHQQRQYKRLLKKILMRK